MTTFQHPPAREYLHVERKAAGKKGLFAVVTISREPVNSMNRDLWQQLLNCLTLLEDDRQIRGVIFCSGLKKDVFTAGNDINELYPKHTTQARHMEFWLAQTQFLARLYRSPLVTVAAIRGACPAGGCVLSMCCDYRVITSGGSIGLNEVAIGLTPPDYWGDVMTKILGQAVADRALTFATMYSADAALKVGLVDQVVDKESLLTVAEGFMVQALKLPDSGRTMVKERLRGKFSDAWEEQGEQEAKNGWRFLNHPMTMKMIGATLARLSAPKKPKAKL